MASDPISKHGSESDFEFIETPAVKASEFEKFEDCGVKTTSVSETFSSRAQFASNIQQTPQLYVC